MKLLKMKMSARREEALVALGIPLSNWTNSQTAQETALSPSLPPSLNVVTEGVTSDGWW